MLCILSDSHDNIRTTGRALEIVRELSPDLIVHCGDIVSPEMLHLFKGLPLRLVLGNCDHDPLGLNKVSEELGFGQIKRELEFEYNGKSFYVYHGTKEHIIDEMAAAQLYDYILHGHTHERRDEVLGRTRIINPGALHRAKVHTIATLDVKNGELKFIEL